MAPALPHPHVRFRRQAPLRAQAVAGGSLSFSEVFDRHHQELFRYCRSILSHDQDAEDVLQATMVKAMAALQEEQRDFELRPWLFRIAHNESMSLLRQQARRPTTELRDDRAALGNDLAQTVEDRQRLASLESDLAALSPRQRSALVLRELSGLSHEEIASVLESTPRAIKQSIFEARSAMLESEQGRAMSCVDIQRDLSDGDGRAMRGRRLRAHLRSCQDCRLFADALGRRPQELAALAPLLPAAAAASLLARIGSAAGAGAGAVLRPAALRPAVPAPAARLSAEAARLPARAARLSARAARAARLSARAARAARLSAALVRLSAGPRPAGGPSAEEPSGSVCPWPAERSLRPS